MGSGQGPRAEEAFQRCRQRAAGHYRSYRLRSQPTRARVGPFRGALCSPQPGGPGQPGGAPRGRSLLRRSRRSDCPRRARGRRSPEVGPDRTRGRGVHRQAPLRLGRDGPGPARDGLAASPEFLSLPLVPGSGREVPPWVLAGPVLARIEALLRSLRRGYREEEAFLRQPRGRIVYPVGSPTSARTRRSDGLPGGSWSE